jgi:hypothetical protein
MNTHAGEDGWMAVELPAERYETVEICLADQTVQRAVWTGAQWWSAGQEVLPVAWRTIRHAEPADPLLQSA